MATTVGTNAILYVSALADSASEETETYNLEAEVTTDFAEDTAHGDVWRTFLPTLSTFGLTIEKHFDTATAGARMLNWVIGRTEVKFYFYPNRTVPTVYFYGNGYLGGGNVPAGLEDVINQTFTLQPSGQPGYVHP
jgi:hypothetical protein